MPRPLRSHRDCTGMSALTGRSFSLSLATAKGKTRQFSHYGRTVPATGVQCAYTCTCTSRYTCTHMITMSAPPSFYRVSHPVFTECPNQFLQSTPTSFYRVPHPVSTECPTHFLQSAPPSFYRVPQPVSTECPNLFLQSAPPSFYRVPLPVSTEYPNLFLQSTPTCFYRVPQPVSTEYPNLFLQSAPTCFYRVPQPVSTEYPNLFLQRDLSLLSYLQRCPIPLSHREPQSSLTPMERPTPPSHLWNDPHLPHTFRCLPVNDCPSNLLCLLAARVLPTERAQVVAKAKVWAPQSELQLLHKEPVFKAQVCVFRHRLPKPFLIETLPHDLHR